MVLDRAGVVHLVNVVATEDQYALRAFALQEIDVLEYGIGGAKVPVLGNPLLRWYDVQILVLFGALEYAALAEADVPVQ